MSYSWIDKAKEIHNIHVRKCKEHDKWSITKTAELLRISIGHVSQNLLIASWLKTHRNQLEKLPSYSAALKFIKQKEKEMDLEELE